MGSKDDQIYLKEAIEQIDTIISYTKDLSYSDFIKDIKTIDATMFRLQQMVEKIKSLSNEYKEKHKNIPWKDIVGFRNGIVHDYGKTDYTTVYEIITIDIYQLKETFEKDIK